MTPETEEAVIKSLGRIEEYTKSTDGHLKTLNGSVQDLYTKNDAVKSDIDKMKGGGITIGVIWGVLVVVVSNLIAWMHR